MTTYPAPTAGGGVGVSSIDAIIAIMDASGIPYRVTSTYRDTSTYHGSYNAVDFAGPTPSVDSPELDAIARFWATMGSYLLELIYAGPNAEYWKNGYRVSASVYGGVLDSHHNHVHVAATLDGLVNAPLAVPVEYGGSLPIGTEVGEWPAVEGEWVWSPWIPIPQVTLEPFGEDGSYGRAQTVYSMSTPATLEADEYGPPTWIKWDTDMTPIPCYYTAGVMPDAFQNAVARLAAGYYSGGTDNGTENGGRLGRGEGKFTAGQSTHNAFGSPCASGVGIDQSLGGLCFATLYGIGAPDSSYVSYVDSTRWGWIERAVSEDVKRRGFPVLGVDEWGDDSTWLPLSFYYETPNGAYGDTQVQWFDEPIIDDSWIHAIMTTGIWGPQDLPSDPWSIQIHKINSPRVTYVPPRLRPSDNARLPPNFIITGSMDPLEIAASPLLCSVPAPPEAEFINMGVGAPGSEVQHHHYFPFDMSQIDPVTKSLALGAVDSTTAMGRPASPADGHAFDLGNHRGGSQLMFLGVGLKVRMGYYRVRWQLTGPGACELPNGSLETPVATLKAGAASMRTPRFYHPI